MTREFLLEQVLLIQVLLDSQGNSAVQRAMREKAEKWREYHHVQLLQTKSKSTEPIT